MTTNLVNPASKKTILVGVFIGVIVVAGIGIFLSASSERVPIPPVNAHHAQLAQFTTEIKKQRKTVEEYHTHAVAIAIESGIPESALTADTSDDLNRVSGRSDFPKLMRARNDLVVNRKILEAAEKSYEKMSQTAG